MQNLNTIPVAGKFLDVANKANTNFLAIKTAIEQLELSVIRSKGFFSSASALTSRYPSPVVGDWAVVQDTSVTPPVTYIWQCTTNGTWSNSGIEWTGGEIDLSEYAKKADVDDKFLTLEMVVSQEESIRSNYISSMSGYCKSSTIASSTIHKLYLYQLTAGVKYKFTKIGQPESSTRLVFTISDETQFVVGGSVGTVLIYGNSSNGDYYYTPEVDTYIVVELRRTSPDTTYISTINRYSFYDFSNYSEIENQVSEAKADAEEALSKFIKEVSIKSDYLSTISAYCKSSTIASSTIHKLYLYQLTAGVKYKFTKIGQPESATRLVFTIADSSQFAVGGSVGTVLVYGSSANGNYYYTPQSDTYVVVELDRKSPSTTYISEVVVNKDYSLNQFEPIEEYDDTPTKDSEHTIKSGVVYNALQSLDAKIDNRTQIVNTMGSGDVGMAGNSYYNTHNKTIGSSAPTLKSTTNNTYAAKFNAKAGFTYVISSRSTSSSDYGRPVVVAVNGIIVAMATGNNVMTTPFTYVATSDAVIYVNCDGTYLSGFLVVESIPLTDYVQGMSVEKTFPVVYMPKKLYGVVGETMQLFYRGIVRKWNPYDIFLQVMAAGFKSTPRYTQTTPVAVGTTTINCRLIDDDYDMSPIVTSTLYRKSVPSSTPPLNVLCMGASTVVNAGCFPVELKRRLCDTGGTPSGLGFSSIQFVGRKTVKSSSVHCEATGGWTWGKFVSAGDQEIRFYLTNADTGYIGAIYSFTSSSGTVQIRLEEWNVTSGEGNALFAYVSSSNVGEVPTSQSGMLTYVSGADEPAPNLSFTNYEVEAANPFWNPSTNSLDIQMYADKYCSGTIDVLICSLNPFNSGVVGDSDITTIVNQMKTFINAYHSDFPNGKVIIDSSFPPSAYYGVEYNYGGTNVRTSWSVLFGRFKWAAACDEVCNDEDYSSFVFYANTFGEMDTEYAFPTTQRAVDTRVTDETETIGTNGIHPTTTGSKMEADAIYRCFICNILN